jgi:DNA-binding HxlR family transcriptional regulator
MPYARKLPPLDPCPVEHVLDMVSGKWKARVIYLLASDDFGFSELRQAVGGVRQQVLSNLLKELEADGVVSRTKRGPDAASRYALTEKGRRLVALLVPIAKWGNDLLAEQGLAWQQPTALPPDAQDSIFAAISPAS